jgi:hypothetical protein
MIVDKTARAKSYSLVWLFAGLSDTAAKAINEFIPIHDLQIFAE